MPDSRYSKGSRRHKIHRFPDDTPFDVQRQIAGERQQLLVTAALDSAIAQLNHGF